MPAVSTVLVLEGERARYLLTLGEPPRAIDTLVAAGEEAERREHVALAAGLFASVGAVYGGIHDFGMALRAYARAARCADREEDVGLSVGCLRAQGHAALNLGDLLRSAGVTDRACKRAHRRHACSTCRSPTGGTTRSAPSTVTVSSPVVRSTSYQMTPS